MDFWSQFCAIEYLAEQVRGEIYYLFRTFSTNELKRISGGLLGTTKTYNYDIVKTQQIIKRIANYSERIGECLDIMEKAEKDCEQYKTAVANYRALDYMPTFGEYIKQIKSASEGAKDRQFFNRREREEPTRYEVFKLLKKWYGKNFNQSKLGEALGISQQVISVFLNN